MSSITRMYGKDSDASPVSRLMVRAANKALNNILVESLIVSVISLCYIATRTVDSIFQTKFKKAFVSKIHDISRDELSLLRKTQIKYIFRLRYRMGKTRIRLAGGSYWLSIPCIVEGVDRRTRQEKKYMGKIINGRSAIKHKYMTVLRNLGVLAEGIDFRFDDHASAYDMVQFERHTLANLKKQSIRTPEIYGLHRLNGDDYILVMEYIDGMPLSKVNLDSHAIDEIFRILRTMHDNGVFHGDIKLDNFLYSNGSIVVVDCLKINDNQVQKAQEFDLICAICALSQRVPVDIVLAHARKYHSDEELNRAGKLMGIAMNKVELDLPEDTVKEIRLALSVAA